MRNEGSASTVLLAARAPGRLRPLPTIVAAGVLALFVVVATVFGSPVGAATGDATISVDDAIPDVVILFPDTSEAVTDAEAAVERLGELAAVRWASADPLATGGPAVSVAFRDPDGGSAARAIDAALAGTADRSEISVAGRAISDREVQNRLDFGIGVALLAVGLVTGAIAAWLTGPVRGALAGLTIGVVAWLAGAVGGSLSGPFDGSIATTSVPAVVGAVVVSGFILFRLLVWFAHPVGDDQAAMIRQAAWAVGVELLLGFAGLSIVAVVLEVTGDARSVAPVLLAGAFTAAVLTLAIVTPAFAAAHGDGDPLRFRPAVGFDEARKRVLPIPNGPEFPVGVLAAFGVFLVVLGLFSFRSSSSGQLLDERALGENSAAVAGTRALLAADGDPTAGILARFDDGAEAGQIDRWLEEVSELGTVARVDTAAGRYRAGGFTAADGIAPALEGDGAAALIVPTVTGRSAGAVDLVGEIEALDAEVDVALSGAPVDAAAAEEVGRTLVWLTIFLLAVSGGAAVYAVIGDLGTGWISMGLRLVGLAAVAGMYRLLAGPTTGAEVQLAVLVVALGTGLFELGFIRRLLSSNSGDDTDRVLERALNVEGGAATMALGLAGVAGLGILAADLALARRLGTVLAVVVLVKVVIGVWLLRPALLGTTAVSHFASKPVAVALASLSGPTTTSRAEHRAWVDVVADLITTDFALQSEPDLADLGRVYLPGTGPFDRAAEQHEHLGRAGLRVVGRPPQLRSLRVVDASAPATVVITVDHPSRQLIDRSGNIVGIRKPERRSVMLWMSLRSDGTYRIADAVELGATPLGTVEDPAPAPAVVPASID